MWKVNGQFLPNEAAGSNTGPGEAANELVMRYGVLTFKNTSAR
jgi:hypothetical protein